MKSGYLIHENGTDIFITKGRILDSEEAKYKILGLPEDINSTKLDDVIHKVRGTKQIVVMLLGYGNNRDKVESVRSKVNKYGLQDNIVLLQTETVMAWMNNRKDVESRYELYKRSHIDGISLNEILMYRDMQESIIDCTSRFVTVSNVHIEMQNFYEIACKIEGISARKATAIAKRYNKYVIAARVRSIDEFRGDEDEYYSRIRILIKELREKYKTFIGKVSILGNVVAFADVKDGDKRDEIENFIHTAI